MSKEKQIEEMAKVIDSEYDCIIPCKECPYYNYTNCTDVKSAIKLYNAGYRKQSDVVREIFEEINEIKKQYTSGDIDGNELYVRLYLLEKKHTEGGE